MPGTYDALRTAMIQSVAVALECYRNNIGNIGSLDRLAATTTFMAEAGDEAMDINKIGDCFSCGKTGHKHYTCPTKQSVHCPYSVEVAVEVIPKRTRRVKPE